MQAASTLSSVHTHRLLWCSSCRRCRQVQVQHSWTASVLLSARLLVLHGRRWQLQREKFPQNTARDHRWHPAHVPVREAIPPPPAWTLSPTVKRHFSRERSSGRDHCRGEGAELLHLKAAAVHFHYVHRTMSTKCLFMNS